jgi:hypothetical protein
MTARQLYHESIKQLPEDQRLQLAAMILNDIAKATAPIDVSDDWTDEDLRDVTNDSMRRFAEQHGDDDDYSR